MSFEQFITSSYGILCSAAAVAATVWGLAKAVGAFRKWVKAKWQVHRAKTLMPEKIYASIEELKVTVQSTNEKLQMVSDRMNDNDEATAALMLEKLMWAYHKFVLEKQDIPLDTKTAMCVMFEQYKKNPNHNHVPLDFIEKINECKVVGSK